MLLPILAAPLLPKETAVTGGSGSGGQLGVIVKWDFKRKKNERKRDRETKGLFHFYLPTETLLIYEKQMCDWFEKETKERIWCTYDARPQ